MVGDVTKLNVGHFVQYKNKTTTGRKRQTDSDMDTDAMHFAPAVIGLYYNLIANISFPIALELRRFSAHDVLGNVNMEYLRHASVSRRE
jgi:hypothetical protein